MITARTPFQIYRAEGNSESIARFNSMSPDTALPYKIRAAEETLIASLAVVDSSPEEKIKYAISTLKSACTYVSLLASYLPIMSRSQAAQKVSVHYDALARIVSHFTDEGVPSTGLGRCLALGSSASTEEREQATTVASLSDFEGYLNALEKAYRQRAKDSGEKVEMLKKIAPEIPVTPSKHENGLTNNEEGIVSDDEAAKERKRSRSSQDISSSPGAKLIKLEDGEGEAHDASAAAAATTSAKTAPRKRKPAAGALPLVMSRLRALTNGEKKAVGVLNTMNELLAHVFATKFNDLIVVFDHLEEQVKVVQSIMDAERAAFAAKDNKKPPEPFHDVTVDGVQRAIGNAIRTFREDEDCRAEFDEDLLHPISHACLAVVNQIEGYATAPFQGPTEEEKQKKAAARLAAKQKREDMQRKAAERIKAKEELANKKEEEKRLVRQRLGGTLEEEALIDDDDIVNPVPCAYVHYNPELPLGDGALFEKALFVWSMLVSTPQPLLLSQMPFKLFLKGLEEEDQDANGLMEEITRCLLDVCVEHNRVSSPTSPRMATRGKNWFQAFVEFVSVASGNRKIRQQQRRKVVSSSSEEDDDDDDDDDEDSSSDEVPTSSSSTTADEDEEEESNEEKAESGKSEEGVKAEGEEGEEKPSTAEVAAAPEDESSPFEKELRESIENVNKLRSMATWGNVDMVDRLNLLMFCIHEALGSDKIRDEADALYKQHEDDTVALEKTLRDIRDEAEKEVKVLLKALPVSGAGGKNAAADADTTSSNDGEDNIKGGSEYNTKREKILQMVDKKRKEAYAAYHSKQDGRDIGAIITPLGMDRYRRLYWRFPLNRDIHIQTTAHTREFPLLVTPGDLHKKTRTAAMLLDEEDDGRSAFFQSHSYRGGRNGDGTHAAKPEEAVEAADAQQPGGQRDWGILPAEYIPTFVKGLDIRGEREAHLRQTLEEIAPYLQTIEEPTEGRVTRSRAHSFGYLNKLKPYF